MLALCVVLSNLSMSAASMAERILFHPVSAMCTMLAGLDGELVPCASGQPSLMLCQTYSAVCRQAECVHCRYLIKAAASAAAG